MKGCKFTEPACHIRRTRRKIVGQNDICRVGLQQAHRRHIIFRPRKLFWQWMFVRLRLRQRISISAEKYVYVRPNAGDASRHFCLVKQGHQCICSRPRIRRYIFPRPAVAVQIIRGVSIDQSSKAVTDELNPLGIICSQREQQLFSQNLPFVASSLLRYARSRYVRARDIRPVPRDDIACEHPVGA